MNKKTNLNRYNNATRDGIRYAITMVKAGGYYTENATDCKVFINDIQENRDARHIFTACLMDELGDSKGYKIAKALGVDEYA